MKKHLVIIGGGASGIAAAIYAGSRQKNVKITIIEKNERIGKKLLQTGNGKCNLTNDNICADSYSSPLAKKSIEKYGVGFTKDFLKQFGIILKSDAQGRNYPFSESAATLLNAFLSILNELEVEIITSFEVKNISYKNGSFTIKGERDIYADAVILSLGSNASLKGYNGYDLHNNIGIKYKKFTPALCPVPSEEKYLKSLKGVRVKARVTLGENSEIGEVQFNEKNISGICVFNLAVNAFDGCVFSLDFMPEYSAEEIEALIKSKKKYSSENSQLLDGILLRKLALEIIKRASLKPSGNAEQTSDSDIKSLTRTIKNFEVHANAPALFASAQSVSGGVGADEVNIQTLESKKYKGLFLCGETLDVDAPCGGYNLQWALSSGFNAADNSLKYLEEK